MADPPSDVAAHYSAAPEPQQSTMRAIRARVLAVIPDAAEVVKYKMPTFVVDGVAVCGLMSHTNHVGYYPYSGTLLEQFPDLVAKYGGTKSALHVPIDAPLSATTVRRLVRARIAQGR
jgi:uncharacterized protein YdhG (YjbR/CyaY superfamily)